MRTILTYCLIMLVLSLVGALIWGALHLVKRCRASHTGVALNMTREWVCLLWLMFLTGLLGLTLTPAGFWSSLLRGEVPMIPPPFQGGINLEPFHVSAALLRFYIRHGLWAAILINFPGNILIFMPVGFFTALLMRRSTWWKSTLLTGALSLFIEIFQMFVSRGTDIDDLILNTLGGFLGWCCYRTLKSRRPEWIQACCKP